MNKMFTDLEVRFSAFQPDQKDLIEKGCELYNQYKFEKFGKKEYAYLSETRDEKGNIIPYSSKNKAFVNALLDCSYKYSGLDKSFGLDTAIRNTNFRQIMFSLLEMVVDRTRPVVDLAQGMAFAEIKNMAEGDSLTLHIPSKHLLAISSVANGKRTSQTQLLHSTELTLAPQAKQATVEVDVYKLLCGTQDLGFFIDQLNRSFEAKLYQEIIDTMFGAYNTLGAQWKEATYAEDSFIQLCQRVGMANGVEPVVFGTKIAMKKIVPTNDYFKMGMGNEYVKNGYIANPWGYQSVLLEQTYKPLTDFDFSTPNDKVLILSSGTDKPVKIGMEGRTLIEEDNKTADNKYIYTVMRRWDVQIITQSNYGVVKVS